MQNCNTPKPWHSMMQLLCRWQLLLFCISSFYYQLIWSILRRIIKQCSLNTVETRLFSLFQETVMNVFSWPLLRCPETGTPCGEDLRYHTKISPQFTADILLLTPSVCVTQILALVNTSQPQALTINTDSDWEVNKELILKFSPAH